jgi:hypothetical protein
MYVGRQACRLHKCIRAGCLFVSQHDLHMIPSPVEAYPFLRKQRCHSRRLHLKRIQKGRTNWSRGRWWFALV